MLIQPLPPTLFDAAVALWHEVGLTRPWPVGRSAAGGGGPASAVLAGLDDGGLLATAMVGHDGHRGSVYYVAVRPDARGNGHGREIMRACEDWLSDRGIPKLNLMVRGQNESTAAFYAALGYGRDDVVVLSKRLD